MTSGSGMMARALPPFRDDQDVLIFASSVSDSLESGPDEFARARSLLAKARSGYPDKLLVYFGTCGVEDPDCASTPYVAHKIEMESLLEDAGSPWMLLRLPRAIGPNRKGHTLAPELNLALSDRYLERVLRKYFSDR